MKHAWGDFKEKMWSVHTDIIMIAFGDVFDVSKYWL